MNCTLPNRESIPVAPVAPILSSRSVCRVTVGMVEDMSGCIVAGDAIPVARIRQCTRPRRPTPPAELLRLFNHYYQERNMPLALAYAFVAAKCGLKRATVERRHLAALGQAINHLPLARSTNC